MKFLKSIPWLGSFLLGLFFGLTAGFKLGAYLAIQICAWLIVRGLAGLKSFSLLALAALFLSGCSCSVRVSSPPAPVATVTGVLAAMRAAGLTNIVSAVEHEPSCWLITYVHEGAEYELHALQVQPVKGEKESK
jgi:hypothetical protein